jgi:hypothetical protein
MKFIRKNWYNIELVVAIGTTLYLAFAWHNMTILQILLLANFVAVLLHQFEEYGFPGGFPAIMNNIQQHSSTPDRYPLNQNSAMVANVLAAYGLYLIPVFFPTVIWLGLAPMLLGIAQFFAHGIMINIRLRTLYNPGLGAVVFLHIPIGIYYIYYILSTGIVSVWDWVIGPAYAALLAFIFFNRVSTVWLADKNSPYVFSEAEMRRFHVQEKLDRLNKKASEEGIE